MLLVLIALPVLAALHLRLGAAPVPWATVRDALLDHDPTSYDHVIVVRQRLVRLAVALYAGAVLGVAGHLLQRILRNGLVSPSTLGLNAGATMAVVLSIRFLGLGGGALFVPALAGACLALGLTFAVAGLLRGQGEPRLNLVLAGALVGTLFSSLTTFVVSLDPESFGDLLGWLIGDIGNFDYLDLPAVMVPSLLALTAALAVSRAVDVLALGEEQAVALGVDVAWISRAGLAAAILLSVGAVTVVEPIGFVGLVVPHAARLLAGENGAAPLWLSLLLGALLVTGADIVARTALAPRVMVVGTVLALLGGTAFLALLLAASRGRGGAALGLGGSER